MNIRSIWAVPALLCLTAAPAAAQDVGSYLPALTLEDFAQTGAKSMDDFVGRTLLIEFFAYW